MNRKKILTSLILLLPLLLLSISAPAADYYLRADSVTKTINGELVTVWGFALDSSFEALDGTVTVPGPALDLPAGDTTLTIHLDNDLDVPLSLVIPGQLATMAPTWNGNRVRSLTHETPAGNTTEVFYTWTGLRPGTYMYHAGTHLTVQFQMGLYGTVTSNVAAGEAYPGVFYDNELTVIYSEVDPALHQAVAGGTFGTPAMSSTVDYNPQYFLVNGDPFTLLQANTPAGEIGETTLIRFVNAGLKTHVPVLNGLQMLVVAEDGYPYTHPRKQFSLELPAGKTKDVLVTPTTAGTFALFDRRLDLTNGPTETGGLLTIIEVQSPAALDLVPDGDTLDAGTLQATVQRGSALGFQVSISNSSAEQLGLTFGSVLYLPNGQRYPASGYLVGPVSLNLPPGQSRAAHLNQFIPGFAPLGTYIYSASIFTADGMVYSSQKFPFEVVAP